MYVTHVRAHGLLWTFDTCVRILMYFDIVSIKKHMRPCYYLRETLYLNRHRSAVVDRSYNSRSIRNRIRLGQTDTMSYGIRVDVFRIQSHRRNRRAVVFETRI